MITAQDLFCLYPTPRGHVAALRGLTLTVAPGERLVVHGPNGSGKTTLLRVLAGERAPSAGLVSVCGVDLVGAGARERTRLRATRLGLVDQRHTRTLRPELDVLDNVGLQLRLAGTSRDRARRRAAELLDRLGLGELGRRRPLTLSGGEAQRVAVCAAVAHGPELVLADEPTGELDRDSATAVYDLLVAATEPVGAALVLVSHDIQAMRVAHRVVRIRDGRLSEEWRPDQPETLVVDARGWVRLPEPLRRTAGLGDRVDPKATDDGLLLRPAGTPVDASTATRPATQPATPAHAEVVAQLAGVGVRRAGRVILADLDLTLTAGTLTVVRGRSGSGKTTLLRILAGLERPDSGEVRVCGIDLAGLDRAGLAGLRRDRLAVAGQGSALLEAMTAAENLRLARQVRALPDDPAIEQHWLAGLGLAALAQRPVRVLSGGERQRVSVARTLIVAPRMAVLDEPTSQQDEANAQRLVEVLREAAGAGITVLAASHDPVLVDAADTVLTLT